MFRILISSNSKEFFIDIKDKITLFIEESMIKLFKVDYKEVRATFQKFVREIFRCYLFFA